MNNIMQVVNSNNLVTVLSIRFEKGDVAGISYKVIKLLNEVSGRLLCDNSTKSTVRPNILSLREIPM